MTKMKLPSAIEYIDCELGGDGPATWLPHCTDSYLG
jgi:hypothetical protein